MMKLSARNKLKGKIIDVKRSVTITRIRDVQHSIVVLWVCSRGILPPCPPICCRFEGNGVCAMTLCDALISHSPGKDALLGVIPSKIDPPLEQLSLLRLVHAVVKNPIRSWPRAVYEEPLLRTRMLGREYTFVMAPEFIRQILVDDAEYFHKGFVARRALEPALGDAILTADGARWRWQRRAAAPIFRQEGIGRFVPAMIAAAERTRDRWLSYPRDAEIDVAHEMVRTTFDIIFATILPDNGELDRPAIEAAITDYLESTSWVLLLAMIGAPRWLPYPGRGRARRGVQYLRPVLDGLIAAARRSACGGKDLLSLLMAARDPETGRAMSDEDIRDNLLTFITAGHETSALALTWALYLIALHPEVEQRIKREIAAATAGAALRPDHIERLGYVKQVVQEAMRLYPPAPLIAREALQDFKLGSEYFKAGATLYIPIYAVHRHRRLWDRPDIFDPDRFEPETAKARNRYAYLPFGAGPRICIGMSFAQAETTAIVAVLASAFTLRLRPDYIPEPKFRVTLRPARGMPMRRLEPSDCAAGGGR